MTRTRRRVGRVRGAVEVQSPAGWQVRAALDLPGELARDAARQLRRDVRRELAPLLDAARAFLPPK